MFEHPVTVYVKKGDVYRVDNKDDISGNSSVYLCLCNALRHLYIYIYGNFFTAMVNGWELKANHDFGTVNKAALKSQV